MPVRRSLIVWVVCCVAIGLATRAPHLGAAPGAPPEYLTNEEFWSLSERLSEPDGYFRSDNLLSNELYYPEVLDRLVRRAAPDGVYLGVGPEQNFSYIAALAPSVAFITDIRRGNLHLHLMYKALFELSRDRVDFVSRLFTKPRPADLTADSSSAAIMDAFWVTDTSARPVFDENLKTLQHHLTGTRRLPLSAQDLAGIAHVYEAFYWFGPSISYTSSSVSGFGRRPNMANYHQLMLAHDTRGVVRSFLGSEAAFAAVRGLQQRNLIVPVVGDFAGARALRAIGNWVRGHGATVSVFYLSNVEQYLRQQGQQAAFCSNVAAMPLGPASTFVRSEAGGGGFRSLLGDMGAETRACVDAARAGEVPTARQAP